MKSRREGSDATVIGEVTLELTGKVYLKTSIGGSRILPLLTEEQLPRIC
jgi:hydrogenase expression/formation protein HypE